MTSPRWYYICEDKLVCFLCFQSFMFLCGFLEKSSFSYSLSLKSVYAVLLNIYAWSTHGLIFFFFFNLRYSPDELRYLPLNTALYEPPLDPELPALDSDGDSDDAEEGRGDEKRKTKGNSVRQIKSILQQKNPLPSLLLVSIIAL